MEKTFNVKWLYTHITAARCNIYIILALHNTVLATTTVRPSSKTVRNLPVLFLTSHKCNTAIISTAA
jgi:hypothetical protein